MLVPADFTLSKTGEPNSISGYHANVQATPTSYSYPSPTSATDMPLVIMILISNLKRAFKIGNGINLSPHWFVIQMDTKLFSVSSTEIKIPDIPKESTNTRF